MSPKEFSIWELAFFVIPVALVALVRERWFGEGKRVVYAFFRMSVQLTALGYILVLLFSAKSPLPVVFALFVMTVSSAWIALGSIRAERRGLFLRALFGIVLGGWSSLGLAVWVVLRLSPWWYPRYLLPLAGMTFSAALNAVSLAGERYFSAVKAGISEGDARAQAYRAALIPYLNSLLSAGLVSIPGMMTGQILAGVSPLLAVKYQALIMALIFSSAGLSSLFFLLAVRWYDLEKKSSGRQE